MVVHGTSAGASVPKSLDRWLTPGSRGLHTHERCASRGSRRSGASVRAAISRPEYRLGLLGRCLLAGLAVQRDRPPAPRGQGEEADRDRDRGLGGEDQVGDEVQHAGEGQAMAPVPAIASRLPLRTIASLSPSRKRRRW
jgi:hypothetical protein